MSNYVFNPIERTLDITGTGGSGLSTPVAIAEGGTGATGSQAALNNLTQAPSHSVGDVLKIGSDGNAKFSSSNNLIPEYTSDPTSVPGDAWILRTDTGGTSGTPLGLLLTLTQSVGASQAYKFSYKSSSGSVVRTTLS